MSAIPRAFTIIGSNPFSSSGVTATQIAYGSATDVITGNGNFTYVPATGVFTLGVSGSANPITITGNTNGAVAIAASGTNQNITLTPSGTGSVSLSAGTTIGVDLQRASAAPVVYQVGNTQNGTIQFGVDSSGNGFFKSGSSAKSLSFATASASTNVMVAGSGNLLLGGLTTDGTGVLQFPAATTSAGGITLGTDINLYRADNRTLVVDSSDGSGRVVLDLRNGGVTKHQLYVDTAQAFWGTTANLPLILRTNSITALTLDTSQNATFAGAATFPGSSNKQRFFNNFATAGQTPSAATRTYITGSKIVITAGTIIVGTIFRWRFAMTKTAAGSAASTIDIAFGTAGTTSDTAQVSFTKPAGTAVADEGWVEIQAIVNTNSSSGVVVGEFTMIHNLLATGHMTIPCAVITTTSGTFNTTTPTNIGLCITTGASDAITISQVSAETINL